MCTGFRSAGGNAVGTPDSCESGQGAWQSVQQRLACLGSKFEVADGILMPAVDKRFFWQLGELANESIIHLLCIPHKAPACSMF